MKMVKSIIKLLTLALALGSVMTCPLRAVILDFTLTLDTLTDPGATYNNYTKAEASPASTDSFVTGFEIEITSVDGTIVNLDPVAAFCSEIAEPISTGSFSFDLSPISSLAAGTAQLAGTASSNIPTGGIGALRAARLAYLFDTHYTSSVLTDWNQTETNPEVHAFQLAVWEITHDDDLNLTAGDINLGLQSGGTDLTLRNNARTLASQWITDVANAGIDSSYESSAYTIYALTNDGSQDVILALEKGSIADSIVPEPGTSALLAGISALAFVMTRRRSRSA